MKTIKIGRPNKHKISVVTWKYWFLKKTIRLPMTKPEIAELLERERPRLTTIVFV